MEFDKEFLDKLFEQAMENPRLRHNFDLPALYLPIPVNVC